MRPGGWRIALYVALVFAAGIGVGVLAQRYVMPVPVRAEAHPPRESDRFRKAMVEELTKRLKLDPGQAAQLQTVLNGSRKEFQAFRELHKDEMKAIYDRQHDKISAFLRADQRIAYEKLRLEREQHEREEKAKRPPESGH